MYQFKSVIASVTRRAAGRHGKEVGRFIRFAFVGALGFLIGISTVVALQNTILPPEDDLTVTLVTCISLMLAGGVKFAATYLWVYPDSRSYSMRRQLAQFAIVSVIGLIVHNLWVSLTYEDFGVQAVSIVQVFYENYQPAMIEQNKVGTSVAWMLGVAIGMFWNFLANRYWTFGDVD